MKKIRIVALVAAVAMFVCVFMVLKGLESDSKPQDENVTSGAQKITVVVATRDIPPYTTITSDMLATETKTYDKKFADFFQKTEDVVGMVTTSDIFLGDTVSQKRVVKNDDGSLGLAYKVEEGMRAVTIAVNIESGVANALKIGNYVDVVFTIGGLELVTEDEDGDGNGDRQEIPAGVALDSFLDSDSPANSEVLLNRALSSFSYIAFQKVKLLAIDDKFFQSYGDRITGNTYASVTLEMTPEQATQLVFLRRQKNISGDLLLRNQYDEELINDPRSEILQPYDPNLDLNKDKDKDKTNPVP